MRNLFDDFLDELRKREAAARERHPAHLPRAPTTNPTTNPTTIRTTARIANRRPSSTRTMTPRMRRSPSSIRPGGTNRRVVAALLDDGAPADPTTATALAVAPPGRVDGLASVSRSSSSSA
jgi:hypothetical protein